VKHRVIRDMDYFDPDASPARMVTIKQGTVIEQVPLSSLTHAEMGAYEREGRAHAGNARPVAFRWDGHVRIASTIVDLEPVSRSSISAGVVRH